MATALVIGIDLSISGSVSSILSHERKVVTNFLANAPTNWSAEILMHTNNSDVASESDVVAIVNSSTRDCVGTYSLNNTQSNIMCWVSQNIDDYDLVIFSYDLDGYYGLLLSEIINEYDTPIFMAMPNVDATNTTYKKSNIVYVGGGVSSNVRGKGSNIECYDDTSSGGTLTSYTTPTVAGKFATLLSTLTVNQALKALRYSCSLDDWTISDGFGKVPDTISTPSEYLTEPPQGLLVFVDNSNNVRVNYTEFYGESYDSVRVYVDDVLFYDGNGTAVSSFGWGGYGEAYKLISSQFKRFIFSASNFTEGVRTIKVLSVKDGVESRDESYNTATVTIPYLEVAEEEVTPEPDAGEETEAVEEEEEEETAILPTPTPPSLARSSETVTVTPNETATTLKLYRKTRIEDDWELVGTTTESTISDDTTDADKNYIYAVKIANSETESDYSEPAYIAGTDFGGIAGGYI
jgi:hypothetical protein